MKKIFNQRLRDHIAYLGDEIDLMLLMSRATNDLADLHEELTESEHPELKAHAVTIVKFLTQVAQMGGNPNEQMLLIDYDRATRLTVGTQVQAVPIRLETTHYARALLDGRYLRREF